MFTVLIDQIEHLNDLFIQSYYVGQVYVTNEIIRFNERKLVDKNIYKWSFNTIAQPIPCYGNMMLPVDHILFLPF